MLELFRRTVADVPAYRAFLADQGVDPGAICTIDDFRRLPLATKDSYVRRYPLADRCRHGRVDSCDMVAFSSGATGGPTLWLRSMADEVFSEEWRDLVCERMGGSDPCRGSASLYGTADAGVLGTAGAVAAVWGPGVFPGGGEAPLYAGVNRGGRRPGPPTVWHLGRVEPHLARQATAGDRTRTDKQYPVTL